MMSITSHTTFPERATITSVQIATHRSLVMEMARFARINTRKGLSLFLLDFSVYWLCIAGVLSLPGIGWKFLVAFFAGVKLSNLTTLAHDAAHNSLTGSRRLNWWLAVLSFMPCLFNYRLWVYDHHSLHHGPTNGPQPASYRPLSKSEYDALSSFAQAWYRFIRSANPLAFSFYYVFHRWSRVDFMPGAFLPEKYRKSARQHSVFLWCYLILFIALLACAPLYSATDSITALVFGLVVPFLTFMGFLAAVLYVNHTHPDVPWFDKNSATNYGAYQEDVSVHMRLPKWLSGLIHNCLEHPAHHVYPAVPCYELWNAQARLNQLMGKDAVILEFSLRDFIAITRRCKLYDYENFRWLDFAGNPTTSSSRNILKKSHTFTETKE